MWEINKNHLSTQTSEHKQDHHWYIQPFRLCMFLYFIILYNTIFVKSEKWHFKYWWKKEGVYQHQQTPHVRQENKGKTIFDIYNRFLIFTL